MLAWYPRRSVMIYSLAAFPVIGIVALSSANAVTPATFGPRQTRSVNSPIWNAAGDFNGDGRIDLAVCSNGGANLTTFYGQPGGTFPTTGATTALGFPTRLKPADFNGDGITDLVFKSGPFQVTYGQSNNTFTAPVIVIPPNSNITEAAIAVGDVNGDLLPDIVAGVSFSTSNTGGFYLVLANPAGGFQSATFVGASISTTSVAIADLNRDGHPDIVMSSNFSPVKVAYASSNGGFTFKTFGNNAGVVTGDFNHDNIPDVAGLFGVMLGQPNGDLGPVQSFPGTSSAESIAVADFNKDGNPDLVESSDNAANGVGVILGNGDGTFGSPLLMSASGNGTSTVIAADFNGDGLDDISVAAASSSTVDIFYNTTVLPIPEPGPLALLPLGALIIVARRRN